MDGKNEDSYYQFAKDPIGPKMFRIPDSDLDEDGQVEITQHKIINLRSTIIDKDTIFLRCVSGSGSVLELYVTLPSFVILPDNSINTYNVVNPQSKTLIVNNEQVEITVHDLRPVSESQLHTFVNEYKESKMMGGGTYGDVMGYPTQQLVVKAMKKEDIDFPKDFIREIALYRAFHKKLCIPPLYTFFTERKGVKRYMGMQMGQGTLNDLFQQFRESHGDDRLTNEQDCLIAVKYVMGCMRDLSAQGIIHADIKPENIVIINGFPYLIDLGLAQIDRTKGQVLRKGCGGTSTFRAPEIFSTCRNYDWKSDVYSMGMVLFHMYVGWGTWDAEEYKHPVMPDDKENPLNTEEEKAKKAKKIKERNRKYRELSFYYKGLLNRSLGDRKISNESYKECINIMIKAEAKQAKIIRKSLKRYADIPETIKNIISEMIEPNPVNRPTWKKILGMDWGLDTELQFINKNLPIYCNPFPIISNIENIYSDKEINRKNMITDILKCTIGFKGSLFTFASAVQIADLFVMEISSPEEHKILPPFLWAITCTWISYKLHDQPGRGGSTENKPLTIYKIIEEKKQRFTGILQLANAEKKIMNTLNGNIYHASLVDYVSTEIGYPKEMYEQYVMYEIGRDYMEDGIYSVPFRDQADVSFMWKNLTENKNMIENFVYDVEYALPPLIDQENIGSFLVNYVDPDADTVVVNADADTDINGVQISGFQGQIGAESKIPGVSGLDFKQNAEQEILAKEKTKNDTITRPNRPLFSKTRSKTRDDNDSEESRSKSRSRETRRGRRGRNRTRS